jgi:hypothetical protein
MTMHTVNGTIIRRLDDVKSFSMSRIVETQHLSPPSTSLPRIKETKRSRHLMQRMTRHTRRAAHMMRP